VNRNGYGGQHRFGSGARNRGDGTTIDFTDQLSNAPSAAASRHPVDGDARPSVSLPMTPKASWMHPIANREF
jgi:hypothetical protein